MDAELHEVDTQNYGRIRVWVYTAPEGYFAKAEEGQDLPFTQVPNEGAMAQSRDEAAARLVIALDRS